MPLSRDKRGERNMTGLDVRIERLEPMTVAFVRAEGESPEQEAWDRLKQWADLRGFLGETQHPVFGFNNPNPAPGRREYGYELWMRVGPETRPGEGVEIKEYAGGRFAVARHHGYPYPEVWKQLWDWAQAGGYRWRRTHELERIIDPTASETEVAFDLYLPIED
jgi:DNA gyrase inhibitor GyrI